MILGIVAIVLGCCPFSWFLGIPVGIAAVVLGVLGKQKADRGEATNKGQAQAGLICGIVGAVVSLLYIVLVVVLNVVDLPSNMS
jgi:hypothetical protein